MTIDIDQDLHKELKRVALDKNVSMTSIIHIACFKFLSDSEVKNKILNYIKKRDEK